MSDIGDEEADSDLMEEEDLPIGAEAGDEEGEEEREAQEEDGEEEEEEEKVPDNPLTNEVVGECLSLISRTGDGLAHAYVKLDLRERELTDISILKTYIHLRFVDVSQNNIKDISPLASMSHLLTLTANQNSIPAVNLEVLPYLQNASLQRNKIQSTEGLNHPMLESLCLNFNDISTVTSLDPTKLANLHTLELRGNKLESTAGIVLPTLKNLFVAGNVIKSLEDIDKLTSLQTLHLRDNQIEVLDGFSENLAHLRYINLRGNEIRNAEECKKLKCLPTLQSITLLDCPLGEDDDYRLVVLMYLPDLIRLDKDECQPEERAEALALRQKEEEAPEKLAQMSQEESDAIAPEA